MYYIAKLKWQQPKEESDEMQKVTKSFLVNAMSVTEVELKIKQWAPSNYQDLEITGVSESKITDLITDSGSEVYWEARLGDENEKGKIVPFLVAIDGAQHIDVIKRLNTKYAMSEFLAIKKMNIIVDDDLILDSLPTKTEE